VELTDHKPPDRSAQAIIVGAGPAGLAVAACLKRAGIESLLLEQSDRVGSSWHRHYERLHLHTDRDRSQLPFLPFRPGTPRYPSRLQFIDYLGDYARSFQIEPRFGQQVVSAKHSNGAWEVETSEARIAAPSLIIATGRNRVPVAADWPTLGSFRGEVLHSCSYRNGSAFKDRRVLVVGLGNSGGEIAIDLFEHGAHPSLAVRSAVNIIPRELFGVPILALAIALSKLPAAIVDRLNGPILRVVVGDLTPYGLARPEHGPMRGIRESGRVPLIDVGTVELIKRGAVKVYPAVEGFSEDGVHFAGGEHRPFDAVILATGYRARVNALLSDTIGVLDPDGTPALSGDECALPGLYFCGFRVTPTGMLREIAIEARAIANAISRQLARA
jgi:cation diffusion facilitator CzcD-associated flavoprotein CzcO